MPDYERLERLGVGNFGEVWLVYDHALAIRRAVKFVGRARIHNPTNFYHEPQTLMVLRHANIVCVEDAGLLADGTLYIAMEYLPSGSVETRYRGRPVPLSMTLKLLCDICWGLEYAHNKGFIHRDIKPANILIGRNGEAKLSDFGLASRIPRGESASPYGYLTHLAPEVLSNGETSKLSDIYALGVTAFRLMNGDGFLQQIGDVGELQDLVIDGLYPDRTHYRPYVPRRLIRIINKCMAVEPEQRYQSASTFRRQLETQLVQCDWKWGQKRGVVRYRATCGNSKIVVLVREETAGKFSIETTRRSQNGMPRRVRKDCASGLTLLKMKRRLRQILSRYVADGT